MDHLKKFDDMLNVKNDDNIKYETDAELTYVNKENIRELLPYDARDIVMNDESNSIEWIMDATDEDDSNSSFTLYYNFDTGDLGWEGNDIASDGDYYKPVKTVEEFETAMDEWYSDVDKWNN